MRIPRSAHYGGVFDPSRMMREAGAEPLEGFPGHGKRWRCRCLRCDAEITPSYNNVQQGKDPCGECSVKSQPPKSRKGIKSVRSRVDGFSAQSALTSGDAMSHVGSSDGGVAEAPPADLRARTEPRRTRSAHYGGVFDPSRMMREAGAEPLEGFPGHGKRWRCRCLRCDTEITPSYNNVQQGKDPCLYCSRLEKMRRAGREALQASSTVTRRLETVLESRGLCLIGPMYGFRDPVSVMCNDCKATTTQQLAPILKGNHQCRSNRFLPPRQEWGEQAALDVLSIIGDCVALAPFPGYHESWEIRCLACGTVGTPSLASLLSSQGPCRRCGQVKNVVNDASGDRPYFVYLLHNPKIGATKVGIANEHGSRFSAQTGAWKKALVLRCPTAQEAVDAETAVLRLWRLELKLEPAAQRHSMKGKGYTETAPETGLDPALTLLRQMQADGGWEDVTPSRTGSDKGDR